MSFQLPNTLVHWNWCKDNERFQIIRYEVKINSKFHVLKHEIAYIWNILRHINQIYIYLCNKGELLIA